MMDITTMEARDVEARFAEVLDLAKRGRRVVISENGTAVAQLIPVLASGSKREPGLHQGMGWISDDFDESFPDDFWLGVE